MVSVDPRPPPSLPHGSTGPKKYRSGKRWSPKLERRQRPELERRRQLEAGCRWLERRQQLEASMAVSSTLVVGWGRCPGQAGRPNIRGVLGCIDADFCKQIFVGIRILFKKGIEKKGTWKKNISENEKRIVGVTVSVDVTRKLRCLVGCQKFLDPSCKKRGSFARLARKNRRQAGRKATPPSPSPRNLATAQAGVRRLERRQRLEAGGRRCGGSPLLADAIREYLRWH